MRSGRMTKTFTVDAPFVNPFNRLIEAFARLRVQKIFSAQRIERMQITKQLAVFLANRPGTLARVCDALGDAKINIQAISISDTVDHSVVRMVVSHPTRARRIFEEHGTLVVESDVLMIDGVNKPGALAKIAHKLAAAKINIEYAYCATSPKAKKGLLILRASIPEKALKALNT